MVLLTGDFISKILECVKNVQMFETKDNLNPEFQKIMFTERNIYCRVIS